MAERRPHMRTQIDRHPSADAILPAWEADADLDAWTLDELDDELDALRPSLTSGDDAGG
jgi:hypothetical protein